MKAHYRTKNGRITFEIQGEQTKDLFTSIAAVQEVFESDQKCGVCGGEEIRFSVRHVDDYDFYELRCTAPGCFAKLSFGQAKKGGGLFPKRKDAEGNWLEHRGWEKYVKPEQKAAAGAGKRSSAEPNYVPSDDDVPF